MTDNAIDNKLSQSADVFESLAEDLASVDERENPTATDVDPDDLRLCLVCQETAIFTCRSCKAPMCQTHSYYEEGGTHYYCRTCADRVVGICEVCEALHTRPCRECGQKVCQDHQKRVVQRWGWGGEPGQGGFTRWFPIFHTYCHKHGQNRIDVAKPTAQTLVGYDGSSPEW